MSLDVNVPFTPLRRRYRYVYAATLCTYLVPEFVFAGHFIAVCITDSDNNSRVRIIKLLKGVYFYCTSEVFTNPRELRSDRRPPQKQKVQNKPHKCSRRQMVCGTHDWIIYEALILRRYESV